MRGYVRLTLTSSHSLARVLKKDCIKEGMGDERTVTPLTKYFTGLRVKKYSVSG